MIKWNDVFTTKNDSIDDQHKKLFEMINDFEKMVREGQAEKGAAEALEFLGKYVQYHFSFEEKLMDEKQCPSAEENKESHAKFLNVYAEFQQRFEKDGYNDAWALELLKTIQDWLIHHICGIDVQLKYCVDEGE